MTNLDRIAALDPESPDRAGWPCFEGAGEETEDESLPIAWAPGQGPVEFPHGTGVPINEGDMVVVQAHYVLTNDGETCAVNVPAWDFNWQLMYVYQEPVTLSADQTLSVTCDYNTLNADGPVTPGWGTQNEMCLMGMVIGG